MESIEQAVFLSTASGHSGAERRVATSAGVCEADAREIAAWGPTEDSLLADGENSTAVYFHPLPSGAHAIGRTAVARRPGGAAGRLQASTHCLVVRPRVLARFAANPFALVRRVCPAGLGQPYEELPSHLDGIPADGRADIVDMPLLSQLRAQPGPDWMAALVQAAIDSPRTAVVGREQPEAVVAGILNCLPPECRVRMTFSIGLRFCARRPYRLVVLPDGAEEKERTERLYSVAVLDLAQRPPEPSAPVGSWGGLVHRVLRTERTAFFARQLARRPLDFSAQDLPALGLQILEALDASAVRGGDDEAATGDDEPAAEERWEAEAGSDGVEDRPRDRPIEAGSTPSTWRGGRRGSYHAAHAAGFSNLDLPAAVARPSPPSRQLDPDAPEVLEKLERLDDLVFEAVSGNPASLEQLKVFWPEVRSTLGDPLLAESREQYLRYALASWEGLAQRDAVRDPSVAVQSLEVLCVLFAGAID